jgi:hypothetical protein
LIIPVCARVSSVGQILITSVGQIREKAGKRPIGMLISGSTSGFNFFVRLICLVEQRIWIQR